MTNMHEIVTEEAIKVLDSEGNVHIYVAGVGKRVVAHMNEGHLVVVAAPIQKRKLVSREKVHDMRDAQELPEQPVVNAMFFRPRAVMLIMKDNLSHTPGTKTNVQ